MSEDAHESDNVTDDELKQIQEQEKDKLTGNPLEAATAPIAAADQNTITTTKAELHAVVNAATQAATAPLAEQLADVRQKVEHLTDTAQTADTAKATAAEPIPAIPAEAPIVTTPSELQEALSVAVNAVVEANKAPVPDEPAKPTEAETIIIEVGKQVGDVREEVVAKVDAVHTEVTQQISDVSGKVEAVEEKMQQVAAKAEEVAAKAEEVAANTETKLTATIADEVGKQFAAQSAPPNEKAQAATVAVKHLASANKVNAYSNVVLTLLFAAAMLVFAMLYLQTLSKAEHQAAADADTIKALAQDLVNSQLMKNENIEAAIQKKIDSLQAEGLPESKAVPMAYIDPEVVREATGALPPSALKLPYVKELIANELSRVSAFAERELNKTTGEREIK